MERIRFSAYFKEENAKWLKEKSDSTGLSMSTILNIVVEKHRGLDTIIDRANRELETAQLVDLQNS